MHDFTARTDDFIQNKSKSTGSECSQQIVNAGSLGVSSIALASCGGGGSSSTTVAASPLAQPSPSPTPSPSPSPSPSAGNTLTAENKAAARSALHASLAVGPTDIEVIQNQGLEPWLDQQMRRTNDSSARRFFEARGLDKINNNLHWTRRSLLDQMIWSELLSGGSGVRKRMALALSEIFVVSVNELNIVWSAQAVGEYWDLLNEHAFGDFRELLEVVTLNPAMGTFLDTRGNQKGDPVTGRVPDENFAREVMQLFTIGLHELNPNGTLRTQNGFPVETYTNDDVEGLARVFTGYDLDYSGVELQADPRGRPQLIPEIAVVQRPMTADPTKWRDPSIGPMHSLEEKSFLGISIPVGRGPEESLRIALDHLFNHRNVAPFFSKQLIQRLVTSNPSPAYIERVARVFENNGRGARGDLGAVFKAVVNDSEARDSSGLTNPLWGKLREPIVRFAQWGRTFGAASSSGDWQIRDLSPPTLLNQAPFRSPSVFNFFRPQFVLPLSQANANDLVAPEFQIVDETSVAYYVNVMQRTIEGDGYWTDDIAADFAYEIGIADDVDALLNHLDLVLTAGQLRAGTRDLIRGAISDVAIGPSSGNADRLRRAQIGVMLVMCSSDYLVQK